MVSKLADVLVCHSDALPLIWPAGLPIYTGAGLPLTQLQYNLQRRIRGVVKLNPQAASIPFLQTVKWGKGVQEMLG